MESLPHERIQEKGAVVKVWDAITAFHDRYMRVVPVQQTLLEVIDHASGSLQSEKARRGADRLRAAVLRWSKAYELNLAGADIITSAVLFGVGVGNIRKVHSEKQLVQPVIDAMSTQNKCAADLMGNRMDVRYHTKYAKSGRVLAASGMGTLVFRPITRIVDIGLRVSKPLMKRIATVTDSILLRREQVFVGQGKA